MKKNSAYGREYYENIFVREVPNSQRNRNRLKLLVEAARGGRLLELGCGTGEFLRIAASSFRVEGIDISQHAVAALRKKARLRVSQLDIETSPLPGGQYDAIAAFNVLEHLRAPAPALQKLSAALRPGGVLVGSVPNNAPVLGWFATGLSNLFDRTHVSTYAPERWRRLFQAAGFREIELFGEVLLGKNINRYLRGRWWKPVSFNLMFVCRL